MNSSSKLKFFLTTHPANIAIINPPSGIMTSLAMNAKRSKKPLSLRISNPDMGRTSDSKLNERAASEPNKKPTKPAVTAAMRLDKLVSSLNQETGASIIAMDDVSAAKNSNIKKTAPKINPPAV